MRVLYLTVSILKMFRHSLGVESTNTTRSERNVFVAISENGRGHNLSAPECIIYAAGGNTLAFTPTSVVHDIADEIERIYTKETLVANSVAVGDAFDLLELQYGLNPTPPFGGWKFTRKQMFRRTHNEVGTSAASPP